MKELWSILMEKLRQVEPIIATIWIGVVGLMFLWMSTIIITRLFTMITEIVTIMSGKVSIM